MVKALLVIAVKNTIREEQKMLEELKKQVYEAKHGAPKKRAHHIYMGQCQWN